jgi:hydroxyethylthiazole kinase-like uncharacterized protein yjeF
MQPILTPEESADLDRNADVPVEVLMERAGLAVAIQAAAMGAGYGRRVTVLCGPGNNGGDGYVAARHLAARGAQVRVLALADPRSHGAKWAAATAVDAGVPIGPFQPPSEADLVVDAVFGAGFRGPLPDEVKAWVAARPRVLAVDLPSGLAGGTGEPLPVAFDAEATVTFQAAKRGHLVGSGPDLVGRLVVADIGLAVPPSGWQLMEDRDVVVPARHRTAHKWSVGGVAVVGGSPGMAGAPVLAARGALAVGAGAALVARPPGLGSLPPGGLLTAEIGEGPSLSSSDGPAIAELAGRWGALVIGPGLGRTGTGLVGGVVERWSGPVVVDADGLSREIVGGLHRRTTRAVLTPHAGEFERMSGRRPEAGAAEAFARETGTVVLLKGNPTFVTDGVETWVVTSGGPELATAGTGDVLAGAIGGLLARGVPPAAAARTAAHLHGRAGATLAARRTVTPEGLADELAATVAAVVLP